MSQENPQSLKTVPPPDLRALLLALRREIMSDINCCLPGTIAAYDEGTQSASVTINLQRQVGATTVAYPMLTDVPVFVLGGGKAYLSFPIAAGDPCGVFFCDRNIDDWWTTGSTGSPPNNPRLHSLSDGFALVGLRSKAGALSGLSATAASLINGTSGINVDAKIGIFNAETSMLLVLQDIILALTALNSVKTGGDASAAIATASTAVTNLLE